MRRLASLLLLALLAVQVGAGEAPSPAELRAQLEALEKEIRDYRQQLEATSAEKSRVERALEDNDRRINRLLNRIKELESTLKTSQRQTQQLQRQQLALGKAKARQQRLLERQLRAAHRSGGQAYLKLLLNQDSPDQVARMMKYYEYFNIARSQQIAEYRATLAELEQLAKRLGEENARRARSLQQLLQQRQALAEAQAQRRQTLAALAAEQAQTGSHLRRLQGDQRQLEALLAYIDESLAALPPPGAALPFAARRGQLLLPVNGRIAQRYGARRSQGLKWKGLLIAAAEGEPVRAIHDGRVVFSDWLRGFGLLLILSHGEGYMSLYGHNQALYRQTGDWVAGDDIIAAVGDTGGQNRAGLYFEIRRQGQPADPQLWCRARPAA